MPTAPCRVCGKPLPLPPWPIIDGSLECLSHRVSTPLEKTIITVLQTVEPTQKDNTMTTQNIFEYATRNKLRFASIRGELTVEQLWDVPLRSKDYFNLNLVAMTANKALKEITEESFVESKKTAEHTRLETALEVVKYVIETKITEEKAAETHAERKKEKEKLLQILAEKQDGKLSELSEKELQKRIAELDA